MNRINPSRFRIAVIHPSLKAGGGSEAVAVWAMDVLMNEYDLTLITTGSCPMSSLNEYYGTQIDPAQIQIQTVPVFPLFKKRFDALRHFNLIRYCKKTAHDYDIMVSAYNAMDFGKHGIQIIGDFSFDDKVRRQMYSGADGWSDYLYRESIGRKIYLSLGRILSGTTEHGWKQNLTIANSFWSASILKEIYGLESRVIYPPVSIRAKKRSWSDRRNGFIFMGRLVPEKGVDKVISMLQKVRQRGHDIHLHILGSLTNTPFCKRIQRLCDDNSDWCYLEGSLSGNRKTDILDQHKYGISGCQNEAFGIAVAEMARAGCIVWVPKSGGQMEIVQQESLMYRNPEEAVFLMDEMLKNESRQIDCQKKLIKASDRFSTDRFKSEILDVIRNHLGKGEPKYKPQGLND